MTYRLETVDAAPLGLLSHFRLTIPHTFLVQSEILLCFLLEQTSKLESVFTSYTKSSATAFLIRGWSIQ
jgi:hypothetical protein